MLYFEHQLNVLSYIKEINCSLSIYIGKILLITISLLSYKMKNNFSPINVFSPYIKHSINSNNSIYIKSYKLFIVINLWTLSKNRKGLNDPKHNMVQRCQYLVLLIWFRLFVPQSYQFLVTKRNNKISCYQLLKNARVRVKYVWKS